MVRSTKAGVREGQIKTEDIDVNTKAIGASELNITTTAKNVGTVETSIDTGLASVSTYWVLPTINANIWESSPSSGGTVNLIADTAGTCKVIALGA